MVEPSAKKKVYTRLIQSILIRTPAWLILGLSILAVCRVHVRHYLCPSRLYVYASRWSQSLVNSMVICTGVELLAAVRLAAAAARYNSAAVAAPRCSAVGSRCLRAGRLSVQTGVVSCRVAIVVCVVY